jgi:hypothetical protein
MARQQPVMSFRAGLVSCAVWENQATVEGRSTSVLKATIERRYRAKDGTWKSSGSFGRNDIPLAIYCLQKAFEAIIEQANQPTEADAERGDAAC